MKTKILLMSVFSCVLSMSAMASDTPPVIPQKLIEHHSAVCTEFPTEEGRYLMRAEYSLPKSPYSNEAKKLYVLGCEMYAYNSLEKAYIVDQSGNITDVYVAEIDHERSFSATSDLMGADYDEKSNTLGLFQKGRGIGDCGSSTIYSYNPEAEKFILIEARMKNECNGEVEDEWPVIYSKN